MKSKSVSLIVVILVVAVLGGAGFLGFKKYKKTESVIAEKIAAMEKFDKIAAEKEAAKKLGVSYPVKETLLSEKQIKEKILAAVKAAVAKKYPKRKLALDILSLSKKYHQAKQGERITFSLKTNGHTVSGIFGGMTTNSKGERVVLISHNKYRIVDIDESYRYYFDESIARNIAALEIKKLKKDFNSEIKLFTKILIHQLSFNTDEH